MFESFRERLQTVHDDLTTGIRTLSYKSKEVKIKKKERREGNLTQFSGGLELLGRYEETWVNLHKRAKECAKAGEAVDREVVMLMAHWEKRRVAMEELQELLQQVPAFYSDLKCITTRVAHLETDFEEMENHLFLLEDLCGQCDQQRFRKYQVLQLENHKKQKRAELESIKVELDSEHAKRVREMEQAQQVKLKERQKFFEEAFQQDMEQYLSKGYLQISDRKEPIGSMSSMEVNVDMLEQMDLMDMSDHEALDVFLNSGGDDNSATSPILDPDPELESAPPGILLRVPPEAELQHEPSSLSSTCEEISDAPMVQSDEEEVQADTALVALPEKGSPKDSDDSDSHAP